jgi:dTDP-4-dehydrorhamnose reductase
VVELPAMGEAAPQTVLLTGASGLLGTWLRRTAPSDIRLVSLTHRTRVSDPLAVTADLRDQRAVLAATRRVRPSLLIHTAYAKDEASIVTATRNVVDAATVVGADVMHISTDALFSGDGIPRDEDANPDPVSEYGRWKAVAEEVAGGASAASAIIRLSLIVSLDPDDHVTARIRAGASGDRPTTWFDDEVRQPAAASELAEALWRIAALGGPARAGVWHLPGPEQLSRYQIAQRVVARLGLDADSILPEHSPPSVDRPRHVVLRDDRAKRSIAWSPSPILS